MSVIQNLINCFFNVDTLFAKIYTFFSRITFLSSQQFFIPHTWSEVFMSSVMVHSPYMKVENKY